MEAIKKKNAFDKELPVMSTSKSMFSWFSGFFAIDLKYDRLAMTTKFQLLNQVNYSYLDLKSSA